MAELDFSDLKITKAWLETQSVEARCAITSRAALRVLPVHSADQTDNFDHIALTSFRAILTTACRAFGKDETIDWLALLQANTYSKPKTTALIPNHAKLGHSMVAAFHSVGAIVGKRVREATKSIEHSIVAGTQHRTNSALPVTNSPITMQTVGDFSIPVKITSSFELNISNNSLILSSISRDASRANSLATDPIWDTLKTPESLSLAHQEFLERLTTQTKWAFWRNWYLAMWNGRFDNWALAIDVIKIDDAVWKAGAEAVAAEIGRIQAEFLTDQNPLAETIQLNPETNRFYATPIPVQNPPLIGALLSRVQDSVADATLGNNGLNDQSREVRVLNRTLSRYSNDPQRVEMDFTSVAVGLRRQIHGTAELPSSEDNLALLEAVEDGVRGIRAAHPDVVENRLILAQQSLRELSADHVELLEDAKLVLVAISEDIMAEDFAADIPSLINDALLPLPSGAPALPGADAATRVFNRSAKMALKYNEVIKIGASVFDSKELKTARLGLTFAQFLKKIVDLGLWVFGVM